MNSVFFPVEVLAILRRLANVISTLSISNQYLLYTRGQSDPGVDSINKSRFTPQHSLEPCDGQCSQPHSPRPPNPRNVEDLDIIHQLLRNPTLYDPIRKPRYPIVLCHGTIPLHISIPFCQPSSKRSIRVRCTRSILFSGFEDAILVKCTTHSPGKGGC